MEVVYILRESFFTIVTLIIGLITYKYLNLFWKLNLVLLMFYMITVILGYLITTYQINHGIPRNNQWLYNIYMLIEAALLMGLFMSILEGRKIVIVVFVFYAVFYIVNLMVHGFLEYNNLSYALLGIIVTSFALTLARKEIHKHSSGIFLAPLLWFSLSLLVYFAPIVPYFSIINVVSTVYPKLSSFLFHLIADVLANVRYLFLGIAFWLVRRQSLKLLPDATQQ